MNKKNTFEIKSWREFLTNLRDEHLAEVESARKHLQIARSKEKAAKRELRLIKRKKEA